MKGILMKPWKTQFIAEHPDMELQTRRVIKPQPSIMPDGSLDTLTNALFLKIKPRYQVGEVVYIKEAHYRYGHWAKNGLTKTGRQKWLFEATKSLGDVGFRYIKNKPEGVLPNSAKTITGWFKRSPLFMPEKYARYFIEITDVRAGRLQEITEEDIIAEGFAGDYTKIGYYYVFGQLWNSINKEKWESNPWVWVYTFKKR